MLMTDSKIEEAMTSGDLVIKDFSSDFLEAASYDMRVGNRLLISNSETEIDMSRRGSATLAPGVFALVTTYESLKLSDRIAGHIGVKSYYTRKGIVMLTGLQIDPGFEGVLVIGLYNASPRSLTLDYLAPFCTVEFHQLSQRVEKPFIPGDEQKAGQIPRADKDYLRTLETQSLSELGQSLRTLTQDVSGLTDQVRKLTDTQKNIQWALGFGFAFLGLLMTLLKFFH
jgi:deoxycytidine triphosphate deaminase